MVRIKMCCFINQIVCGGPQGRGDEHETWEISERCELEGRGIKLILRMPQDSEKEGTSTRHFTFCTSDYIIGPSERRTRWLSWLLIGYHGIPALALKT